MADFKSALGPAIQDFLIFRDGMNYGGHGERFYLGLFDAYCAEHFPNQTHLTKEAVRGWFLSEIEKGHAALENKAISVRMFAKFMGPPAYTLPMNCVPKTCNFVPYILSDDELTAFFNAADHATLQQNPFYSETAPVLLRLLYACGLRPGEALRLKVEDVDLKTGEIFIKNTKRHKDRIIVASDDVLSLLIEYALRRDISIGESTYFFVNSDASPLNHHHLQYLVQKCWFNANPNINPEQLPTLRPYDLRHRFASAVLQRWIDEKRNLYAMMPFLRAYMGHQSFSDTAYYIHILPNRLMNSPGVDWDKIDNVSLEVALWND